MRNIALDLNEGKMYLINGSNIIYRTGLNGSPVEILDDWSNSGTGICGLAVDAGRGKIYWTEVRSGADKNEIVRANVDGSQRETIVSGPEGCVRAIDEGEGKIYWGGSGEIVRANLDGSQRELIFTGTSHLTHIAIDEGEDKIYWTETWSGIRNSIIRRANLDGSQRETIATEVDEPGGVALGP